MKRGALAVPYEALEALVQANGFSDAVVTSVDVHPVTHQVVVIFQSEACAEVEPHCEASPVFLNHWKVESDLMDDGFVAVTTDGEGKETSTLRAATRRSRFITGWHSA